MQRRWLRGWWSTLALLGLCLGYDLMCFRLAVVSSSCNCTQQKMHASQASARACQLSGGVGTTMQSILSMSNANRKSSLKIVVEIAARFEHSTDTKRKPGATCGHYHSTIVRRVVSAVFGGQSCSS